MGVPHATQTASVPAFARCGKSVTSLMRANCLVEQPSSAKTLQAYDLFASANEIYKRELTGLILLDKLYRLSTSSFFFSFLTNTHHQHHHQSLNRKGRWGTTDYFETSFLHFSLFSTALLDLVNFRPVHSLRLSSHLFLCLPCLLPPFTVPCKMVLDKPDERKT